jgi:hypothetical protein
LNENSTSTWLIKLQSHSLATESMPREIWWTEIAWSETQHQLSDCRMIGIYNISVYSKLFKILFKLRIGSINVKVAHLTWKLTQHRANREYTSRTRPSLMPLKEEYLRKIAMKQSNKSKIIQKQLECFTYSEPNLISVHNGVSAHNIKYSF